MAYSKCPKCDSTSFEMQEAKVSGARFKLMFIQCSRCGAVIGVQDYYNIGNLIYKLAEKLHVNLDR